MGAAGDSYEGPSSLRIGKPGREYPGREAEEKPHNPGTSLKI